MGGEVRANKLWTRLLGAQPQAALPHRASRASHAQGRLSYWRNCCNQSYCARVFRRQSYSSGSCTRRISISCELDDEGVKADCKKAEKSLVVNRNEASAKIIDIDENDWISYSRARIASFEQERDEDGRRSNLAVALG